MCTTGCNQKIGRCKLWAVNIHPNGLSLGGLWQPLGLRPSYASSEWPIDCGNMGWDFEIIPSRLLGLGDLGKTANRFAEKISSGGRRHAATV